MANKIIKEYMEEVHNKEQNYKVILSKSKGVGNMKSKKRKILNIAAILMVVIVLGVATPQIYAKIQWDIQFKDYQSRQVDGAKGSLQDAKDSGYAEVLDMDYVTQNGISVKVDSLLITDDCFDANISFKFADDIVVDSQMFSFGYAVYDENENIYQISPRTHMGSEEKRDMVTPFVLKDIKGTYNKKDIYSEQLYSNGGSGLVETNSEERTIISNINIRARDAFPRSKKIYIRVFDPGYSKIELDSSGKKLKVTNAEDFPISDAEWIFEIDVPEKFYERQTTELKLENDIPGLEVEKITLTEAGMVFKFKSEEYRNLISAGKDMNGNEFRNAVEKMLYISDGEGRVFRELSGGTTEEKNGYKMILDAGKKDLNKKLFINFSMNGKQYTSELIEK